MLVIKYLYIYIMKKNVVMNIYKGYKCSFYKYGNFFFN